jgi:hypothetical protein
MTRRDVTPTFPRGTIGVQVYASYRDPLISEYRGNPLIEALPPVLTDERASSQMACYPAYSENECQRPAEERYHLIGRIRRFFQPLAIHLDLEKRIGVMIRQGYVSRNFLDKPAMVSIRVKIRKSDPSDPFDPYQLSGNDPYDETIYYTEVAEGIAIIGVSGVGKSTAIERILALYPQVIFHSKYKGRESPHQQIVWLRLICPHDGSRKSLCLSFFHAIDEILGTPYLKSFRGLTVEHMMLQVGILSVKHSIGVLVIDEIQDLRTVAANGAQQMLKFFVHLENTCHTPVVLIGTADAIRLLAGEFRHARRNASRGDLIWDRMANDDTWRFFTRSLWKYQYVQKPVPWNEELSDTLYLMSQGITDLAVKMFCGAQVRAIRTHTETITSKIIEVVAEEDFASAWPALQALRTGNRDIIAKIPDIYIDFSNIRTKKPRQKGTNPTPQPQSRASSLAADTKPIEPGQGQVDTSWEPMVTDGGAPRPASERIPKKTAKKSKNNSFEHADGLLQLVAIGLNEQKAAYQSLKDANYLRSADEFMDHDR